VGFGAQKHDPPVLSIHRTEYLENKYEVRQMTDLESEIEAVERILLAGEGPVEGVADHGRDWGQLLG